jgi:hypothetical protein
VTTPRLISIRSYTRLLSPVLVTACATLLACTMTNRSVAEEPSAETHSDPIAHHAGDSIHDQHPTLFWLVAESLSDTISRPHDPLVHLLSELLDEQHVEPETELSEQAIGLQPVPERPPLLLELNEQFLAPGQLEPGIELPTGAVWRPSVWVFGSFRTGINYFDNRGPGRPVSEWASRLDLFTQLNLSGTERVLVGLRPLDQEQGNRRVFQSRDFLGGDTRDGWNDDIQTLFFEGDLGEIFPNLDRTDSEMLDIGFSVGRQTLVLQRGLLINEDRIDAVTLTRNTLYGGGNLNLRITGFHAWNKVNRSDNSPDDRARLFGITTESDLALSTVNLDAVYLDTDDPSGSLLVGGLSATQRLNGFHNTYNTRFHLLASHPTNGETAAAGRGELVFSQISWTPHHSYDLVYVNGFWANGQFSSAARGPLAGGPLGQTGLLFSAAGLGRYGAPLSNAANNAVGGSIGYQVFFDELRQQVVVELAGRTDTDNSGQAAMAAGIRYQKAIGQHLVFVIDSFIANSESRGTSPGARVELLTKF